MRLTVIRILSFLLLVIALWSCSTSNKVVTNSIIQKRKYNKGFFITKSTKVKPEKAAEMVKLQEKKPVYLALKGDLNKQVVNPYSVQEIPKKSRIKKSMPHRMLSFPKVRDFVQKRPTIEHIPHRPFSNWLVNLSNMAGIENPANTLGILSFIFGIIGIALFWFAGGVVFSLAATIMGIISMKQDDRTWTSMTGMILGIIGVAFWLFIFLFLITLFAALG